MRRAHRLVVGAPPVARLPIGWRPAPLGPSAVALVVLAMAACGTDPSQPGAGGSAVATGGAGAGAAGGSAGAAGGESPGGAGGGPLADHETEPNDGVADEDYDAIAQSHAMTGALDPAGDVDIFRLPVAPGTVLEARLTPDGGSNLMPHLTVLDDGRGGDAEGSDYVKLARAASGELRMQWLAMGEGGYYVVVRDARNVDGDSVGGTGFGYELEIAAVDRAVVTAGALPVPGPQADTLPFGGAIHLYEFAATAWQEALIDCQAPGDLDGRLTVFAESTGDWIARNDDRSDGDVDPLIDAPLTEGGDLLLVVENIAEAPASLDYELSAAL